MSLVLGTLLSGCDVFKPPCDVVSYEVCEDRKDAYREVKKTRKDRKPCEKQYGLCITKSGGDEFTTATGDGL